MRVDAKETVAGLQARGFAVALLSGDRTGVVARTARAAGIDVWEAEMKPADKIAWLDARLRDGHKVLMAGPASAADISQRAADFVFQGAKLEPVAEAIHTGRRAHRMAFQNFGVAAVYNVICVPLAMAGFVTPLIAAIVMSTSSILVTLNAARLAGGGRS
jgi:Cu2+-exporting ATPase